MKAMRITVKDFHADGSPCGHKHTLSRKPLEKGCPGRDHWIASLPCGATFRSSTKDYSREEAKRHRDSHQQDDVTDCEGKAR